jgi:hypothetical protein
VFKAHEYAPKSEPGRRLLAHELAHVVQQTGGEPSTLRSQADEVEGTGSPEAEEDGAGVETEESSTEEELLPSGYEETPMVQLKTAGEGTVLHMRHLQRKDVRTTEDAIWSRPVYLRAAPAALQRAPKENPERCGRDDTRVSDFADTFIDTVTVDLTSPNHSVTLTWAGPNAAAQPTGPFHSSPGAGCCDKDCDDAATSKLDGSHCTPKGNWTVGGHSCAMAAFPEARNVTWFGRDGIALHFYPSVPKWPASHGCVRLERDASRIIYDNSITDTTKVAVAGTWTRHDDVCWACGHKKSRKKKGV